MEDGSIRQRLDPASVILRQLHLTFVLHVCSVLASIDDDDECMCVGEDLVGVVRIHVNTTKSRQRTKD